MQMSSFSLDIMPGLHILPVYGNRTGSIERAPGTKGRGPIRRKIASVILCLSLQLWPAIPTVQWTSSTSGACWVDMGSSTLRRWKPQTSYMEAFPDSQRQTIDGFGGCFNELEWTALNTLPPSLADSVVRSLYDTIVGCRYNLGRMAIGANDYALDYYSHDDSTGDYAMSYFSIARHEEYVIPFIKAAMACRPDLKMWGSPWTPPAWMKTDTSYAGGSITWDSLTLTAYALYLEKCVFAYQAAGLNFTAVFVQNEPECASGYPTCTWSPQNLHDFIRLYLGPKFRTDSVPAQIWLSTINDTSFTNAAVPSLSDSICRSYLTGIGYQWGGYQAMGTQYKLYPSVPFWQTETECGNGENTWWWADTQYSNRKFAFDSGARAFFEWNMVLEKSGMSSWGWQQSAMISIDTGLKSVTWNPEYYVSKHFSYFIQPGAKYIKTKGTYNDRVAFLNPNGDIVIVVRNNQDSACVTGIKIGSWMFLPTIAANSFNTFVFTGLSSPDFRYSPTARREYPLEQGCYDRCKDIFAIGEGALLRKKYPKRSC